MHQEECPCLWFQRELSDVFDTVFRFRAVVSCNKYMMFCKQLYIPTFSSCDDSEMSSEIFYGEAFSAIPDDI